MSDPHRYEGPDAAWRRAGPTEPSTAGYPPYVDPAYAGQLPNYPSGYPPPPQQQWGAGRPPGSDEHGSGGPPEPPRFPRWLWLVAGAAVLLVVGLVIALAIANDTSKKSATVSPVSPISPLPSTSSLTPPTRTPTTTPSPLPSTTAPSTGPSTTESTSPGTPETVVYTVTGEGRAISIAYIDTGGVLQTEFNVVLPWSKQVSLTPPASQAASVTVVNIGQQITCSVRVDGAQVRERTGSIVTICAAAG